MGVKVTRTVRASVEAVEAVLADGWSYASWVVGAARVRAVDRSWPSQGARIEHSLGGWPLMLHDQTISRSHERGRRLELEVNLWVLGQGTVVLELAPLPPAGDGQQVPGCEVTMHEEVYGRLARLVPDPLIDPLLKARNVESLRRLAALAERAAPGQESAADH